MRKGKQHTYYLSDEAIDHLDKMAKSANITRSKLVEILIYQEASKWFGCQKIMICGIDEDKKMKNEITMTANKDELEARLSELTMETAKATTAAFDVEIQPASQATIVDFYQDDKYAFSAYVDSTVVNSLTKYDGFSVGFYVEVK